MCIEVYYYSGNSNIQTSRFSKFGQIETSTTNLLSVHNHIIIIHETFFSVQHTEINCLDYQLLRQTRRSGNGFTRHNNISETITFLVC